MDNNCRTKKNEISAQTDAPFSLPSGQAEKKSVNPVNPVKKHKPIQFFLIVILSAALLIFPATGAFSKPFRLDISKNRLSADFESTPLSQVLADIGANTGITFLFLGGAAASQYNRPVSFKFEALPIRAALEKLLRDFNCSVISDDHDNISQVFILGSKSGAGSGSKVGSSFAMAANSDTDSGEEPAVNSSEPEEGMGIGPGKGMQITPASNQLVPGGMQINKSTNRAVPEGMVINRSTDKTKLPEGMQIGPGEGMQITPGEGMQIGPPSKKGMEIGPSEGMQIGPGSAEGMVVSPPGYHDMNSGTEAPERVVHYQGKQISPKNIVQRPSRWGFGKRK